MTKLYSIGHGSRPADEFLALLATRRIRTLVDVRARPASARHPQFARETLRESLEAAGIEYHWAGRHLGGFRSARTDSRHAALADAGLRGFADYMEDAEFQGAIRQLLRLAERRGPLAVMCAERNPEHCHRTLISDALVHLGREVIHLLDAGVECAHVLNSRARVESNRLVYDLAS